MDELLGQGPPAQPHRAYTGLIRHRYTIPVVIAVAIAVVLLFLWMAYIMVAAAMEHFEEEAQSMAVLSAWDGKPAPDISLRTLEGEPVTLAALKGRPVLLDFLAIQCPSCVKHRYPHMNQLAENHGDEIVVLALGNAPAESMQAFLQEVDLAYPIVLAGPDPLPEPYSELLAPAAAYDPGNMGLSPFNLHPLAIVIDAEGRISEIRWGYMRYETLVESIRASAAD